MRDWFKQPNESKAERTERIDILLELRIKRLRWGECLSIGEIADYCGVHPDVLYAHEQDAMKKLIK